MGVLLNKREVIRVNIGPYFFLIMDGHVLRLEQSRVLNI